MIQAVFARIDQLGQKLHGLHGDARRLDPDAIHGLRVASRRLRSAISLFEPLLPVGPRRAVRKSLKTLTGILGQPREWDVHAAQLERLSSSVTEDAEHAALEHVRLMVERKRSRCARRLRRDLKKFDDSALQSGFERLAKRRRMPSASLAELVWPELEARGRAAQSVVERESQP